MSDTAPSFPLLVGNSDPCRCHGLAYPLTYLATDGLRLPLFSAGVASTAALAEIARRTAALIAERYAGRRLLVVQILEGARVFAGMLAPHLVRHWQGQVGQIEMGSVQVRSYGQGSRATAHRLLQPLADSQGRELTHCRAYDSVVLVDDLIDGGQTMAWLVGEYLPRFAAVEIGVCAMLEKERQRSRDVDEILERCLISAGLRVADAWLVGYGLDMALPGGDNGPDLHLFRQTLPGGVYAMNRQLEGRLLADYQRDPEWVHGQLGAYVTPE